ncbi:MULTISPECIES: histidinol dehydrogenase [unclassified Microbacterium]|uniref:histidinol dehydrogenase n=1 Tax=unclassified Microbacterium TaxID=2609290 RepID=UPI00301056AC
MPENWISRVLSWVGVLVVGAVFGLATTIAHGSELGPIPIGMIIGPIACAALLVAVRALTRDRWAALAAGIGMLAAVLLISGRGPGGSVLVPDDLRGRIWGYLIAGLVLVIVAWPDLSRLPRAAVTGGPDAAADRARDVD